MENFKCFVNTTTTLSEQSWAVLLDCLTEMEFKKGQNVLEEGEVCRAIYFINKGLCRSYYNLDGKEINTAFYFENEFVTNLKSLKTESKSEYAIEAYEKSAVIRLDKVKLLNAYNKSSEVESFGRRVLELVMLKQEEHANSFKLLSPKQRFDNLIVQQPDFLQRVSLTQIASYLGISRETLSRFRAVK